MLRRAIDCAKITDKIRASSFVIRCGYRFVKPALEWFTQD